MTSDPRYELSNCTTEPIDLPGSIQPHGILLVISLPHLTITHLSANLAALAGIPADALIGSSSIELIGIEAAHNLAQALRSEAARALNPARISLPNGKPFDLTWHRLNASQVIVELEPLGEDLPANLHYQLNIAIGRMRAAETLDALCRTAAEAMRDLNGFDRVMVYRFDSEWHGEVLAEARDESTAPFLGLRFPATDIPAQARALYLRNTLRLIPDVNYQPVALLPAQSAVNLGVAVLRSVSPGHLEYLRNMGVTATMVISILQNERLWGLIACHHFSPRFSAAPLRAACELLAQGLAIQISARQERQYYQNSLKATAVHAVLADTLNTNPDLREALTAQETTILDLVNAQGAALYLDNICTLLGETPPAADVQRFALWLSATHPAPIFATDSLAAVYPPAESWQATASGVLAVAPSPGSPDYVFWFRPEQIQQVRWGGDPRQPYEVSIQPATGETRLSPRRSFAVWQETVRLKSTPWETWEENAARDLRLTLLDVRRQQTVSRTMVGQMLHDLRAVGQLSEGAVFHTGKAFAARIAATSLQDYLTTFAAAGLGKLRLRSSDDTQKRWSFEGENLVEHQRQSRVPGCYYTRGFLCGAVAQTLGNPQARVIGVETACQSMGDEQCVFIIQVLD